MVYQHLATFGGVLARRAADVTTGDNNGDDMAQLPGWAVLVFFADFLVFLPVFLYVRTPCLYVQCSCCYRCRCRCAQSSQAHSLLLY